MTASMVLDVELLFDPLDQYQGRYLQFDPLTFISVLLIEVDKIISLTKPVPNPLLS